MKKINYTVRLLFFLVLIPMFSCQQKPGNVTGLLGEKQASSVDSAAITVEDLTAQAVENTDEGEREKPRILITGSTAGLGELAAKALIAKGCRVVVHARNEMRAADVKKSVPGAEAVVIGDLSSMDETMKLAADINSLGTFDAIIYNAGVYYEPGNVIFKVNALAPYILTCLVNKPKRIIYISSDMHLGGDLRLEELQKESPIVTYSDSKLKLLTLAMAVSRKWPDVRVNAVHPGWVPTRMGGPDAPDDLDKGYQTQVWLAEGKDKAANVSDHYFFHMKDAKFSQVAKDKAAQERLLTAFGKISGVTFPDN